MKRWIVPLLYLVFVLSIFCGIKVGQAGPGAPSTLPRMVAFSVAPTSVPMPRLQFAIDSIKAYRNAPTDPPLGEPHSMPFNDYATVQTATLIYGFGAASCAYFKTDDRLYCYAVTNQATAGFVASLSDPPPVAAVARR